MLFSTFGCGSPASIPFEEFAARKLEAQCERLVRCGQFADEAACSAYFYLVPDTSLAAGVKDHKVLYDGVAAKRCVDEVAKLTCDGTTMDARVPTASCDKVLKGTLATGATCEFDAECTGRWCMPDMVCDQSMCCPGTCLEGRPAAVGSACRTDFDCAEGAFCGTDHVCKALGQEGDTCYVDTQCAYGLGCVTQTFPGICHALAATGQPCPYKRCANIGEVCSAAGMCVAAGLPGSTCGSDSDCSPTAYCDTSAGACASVPDVGMPCTSRCEGDAWCDITVHQCAARLENKAPCNADNQCATNYCEEGVAFDDCADRPVCD